MNIRCNILPNLYCFAGLWADSLTVDDYQGWWSWILALFCEIDAIYLHTESQILRRTLDCISY
jgi:hypothetical protein